MNVIWKFNDISIVSTNPNEIFVALYLWLISKGPESI